jgi:hypothetical protein
MTVKPISTTAIEKATGRSFEEWCRGLDEAGARMARHKEIVALVQSLAPVSGWWAQSVAVAYEQARGKRLPGQGEDGRFTAAAARIFSTAPETVFAAWMEIVANRHELAGRRLARPATTSRTAKRLYWRCRFEDGSRLTLAIEPRPGGRSQASFEHARLAAAAELTPAKAEGQALFEALARRVVDV